jgi:hypothetical protein
VIFPDKAPERPEPKPGDAHWKFARIEAQHVIALQAQVDKMTVAYVLTPEWAEWLGYQLMQAGKMMRLGITPASEMPPNPPNGQPN